MIFEATEVTVLTAQSAQEVGTPKAGVPQCIAPCIDINTHNIGFLVQFFDVSIYKTLCKSGQSYF